MVLEIPMANKTWFWMVPTTILAFSRRWSKTFLAMAERAEEITTID
jgi:hypothetical protein